MVGGIDYDILKKKLRGPLVLPADADYGEHRRIWNRDVDRHPAAIARCLDETDVQEAVRFAAIAGVPDVAVRGGGHSYPGLSTCDDGLVIDLGLMREGRIGVGNRVVLQGGAQLRDLDALTAEIGTAVPAGVEATTGVAGLTLGGGVGSLQRKFGLTCDSLRAVRMVMADGEVVVIDDETDPELMWGTRGGAGNFGIVTELEFQSYPVGPFISSLFVFPIDILAEFSPFYDEYVTELPKHMASCGINPKLSPGMAQTVRGVASTTMPSGPAVDLGGDFFAVSALWVGHPDGLASAVEPLGDWGPVAHVSQPRTHLEMQSMRPELGTPQNRYVRAGYLDKVGTGVLQGCAALADEDRPPVSAFVFSTLGGAVSEVDEHDTAFCGRSSKYLYAIEASWDEPSERGRTLTWVREAYEMIEKHATGGGYINTVTDEGSDDVQGIRATPPREERVRRIFGEEKFGRLQRLKSAWDPNNLFHMNINVPPPAESP